jgi:endonuclease/exonuclease/phosphatase family metal-dependent hydrolase
LKIFTVFDESWIEKLDDKYGEPHWTINRLKNPIHKDINLIAVHFPSKLFWSDQSQSFECVELMARIRKLENDLGNDNTIVIGDFNMNPFEFGMLSSVGLHSLKDRKKIENERFRKVNQREYDMFYNPMWNFLGDFNKERQGTYYYRKNDHISLDWNTFDQVLIRPSLIRNFDENQIHVIHEINGIRILDDDAIPDKEYSDHLPLELTLNL